MERYFKPIKKTSGTKGDVAEDENPKAEVAKKPRVGIVLNLDDVVADPGLRRPIEEYDVGIRDQVRTKYLLMGPCQPAGHKFPRKQQGHGSRSFIEVWFKRFDWLEYSVEKDAAYCFYCYLFKKPGVGKSGSDVFSKSGFQNWKKASESFAGHVGGVNSIHNNARRRCEDFKTSRRIATPERPCMNAILDVARLHLKLGIAFCGPEAILGNKGNFLEMLDWLRSFSESVDHAFKEHAVVFNEMTSPEMQAIFVKSCAEMTTQVIVDEIGDGYFSVLIDTPHDTLMVDRMSVIVRFVNRQGQVIERLLGVEYTTGDTGPLMKLALDGLFARFGLSISKLRGQGYNVASNMREEFDELKSIILKENPHAYYIHCFANRFQLAVVSIARSNKVVGDFLYYVDKIVRAVGDSCRTKDAMLQELYGKIREKIVRGDALPKIGMHPENDLSGPAHTRWGSYSTTLLNLLTMWDVVLDTLVTMCDKGIYPEPGSIPSDMIEQMESFEFVFVLHLMIRVLIWTDDLSCLLERKGKYIVNPLELITSVKNILQDLKENQWVDLLEEVKRFCILKSIPVPSMDDSIPVRGRSRHRGLVVTCHQQYYVETFIALIDLVTSDMNNRFSKTFMDLLRCFACFDPDDSFSQFDVDMLLSLADIYSADFSMTDREILREQLHMFIIHVRNTADFSSCNDLATLALKMVQTETHVAFPLVYRLIELLLVLPVATPTTKRAFSARNIFEEDFCDNRSGDWLSDTMLCCIETDFGRD